jgi:imidazolonepropionase-like amidohydrolase
MQTLIRADLVIDGKGNAIEKGAVLFQGDTILACGRAADIGAPDGAEIIESSGTLLPGLCDVHVHLRSPGTPSENGEHRAAMARMSYAEMALAASSYALNTLKAGFTSVRDCAAPGGVIIDLRNAINKGYVTGPRIKACGLGLTVTGGHMDPPVWADYIHLDNFAAACNGVDGFRQGAREQLKRGADFIKLNTWVSYHDSPDRFWRQEMTEPEIASACDEAHAQGVHVAAHVYGPAGVAASVRNGVDSIEHGHWIDEPTVELMVKHGTTFVPTLTVNDRHASMALANPNIAERHKRWHRRSSEDKWKTLELVRKAGIRVCSGTDVGFQIEHGKWNAHEIVLLVKGGFTPMEAIICATANSTDLMGINAGRLEAGRFADMIILDGNPLDDISLLEKPELMRVFKGGVEIH